MGGNTSNAEAPTQEEIRFTKQADGSSIGSVSLKHGQSITILNLPEGTTYEVKEVDADKDGYFTKVDGNAKGTLSEQENVSVKFTNKKPSKHDLTISKEVKGNLGDKDASWTFKITLIPEEDIIMEEAYPLIGKLPNLFQVGKQEDGSYVGTVSLKSGQTVTIKSLPENTKYTVEEVEANQNGYITKVIGNNTGMINKDTKPITFENWKLSYQDLTISKNVMGDLADVEQSFHFRITLRSPEIVQLNATQKLIRDGNEESIPFDTSGDDLVATIPLKHGESITLKDLPEGTTYKVEEVEANQDDYETIVNGKSEGTINNENVQVDFINKKYSKHDLTIQKEVTGWHGELERLWNFTITLKSEENLLEKEYLYKDNEGTINVLEIEEVEEGTYKVTFTLKSSESMTILDLPYGTEYTVEEAEANKDGYETKVEGNSSGVLTDEEEEMILFINHKKEVNIPNTGDTIKKYALFFVISVFTILGSLWALKRLKKKA